MLKHDLEKLQNNYFGAAIKNLEASNNIFYEFIHQLFSLRTFYLIFTATLFFFLQDKLNIIIFSLPIKVWFSVAIIFSTLSVILGIIALWLDKVFLLHSARYYFKKSEEVNKYIKEKDQIIVDSVPQKLEINREQMVSCKLVNYLIIFQSIFFIFTILLTVIQIIITVIGGQ